MTDLLEALERLGTPRLLVVGDLVLDRHTWGAAERLSPEAPVPVLHADVQEARPGGAAAVACLAQALGARVSVAGVIGCDGDGRALRRLLRGAGVDEDLVCCDPRRPTTVKERFLGRTAGGYPHQLLRLDRERRQPLDADLEWRLAKGLAAGLARFGAVLVSDYAKGVCTPWLLARLLEDARAAGVPVLVDPAFVSDYGRYRGADLLTPNRREAALAAGLPVTTVDEAEAAGRDLVRAYDAREVLVKLDRDGMVLVLGDGLTRTWPAQATEVVDPAGAGDMVLAVLGLCQASGLGWAEAAPLASVAAAWQVGQVGVAPLSRDGLRGELLRAGCGRNKLVAAEELRALGESYRRAGRCVVFSNGCFDLLHAGHVRCLQEAAGQGDVLVVGVNSDRGVRRLKGPGRPVIGQAERALLLAALACVTHVVVFDEDTPHGLLAALRPDVLVKGGTTPASQVVGREVVEGYGGRVGVVGHQPGLSTTQIVDAIRTATYGEAS